MELTVLKGRKEIKEEVAPRELKVLRVLKAIKEDRGARAGRA